MLFKTYVYKFNQPFHNILVKGSVSLNYDLGLSFYFRTQNVRNCEESNIFFNSTLHKK